MAEAESVERLRRAGLPPFEVNGLVVIGARRFFVDVLWRRLRLALEIDSREYHFRERDWQHTLTRHNLFTAAGWAMVHYPPSATRGPGWPAEVAALVRTRAAEIGVRAS